MQDPKSRKCKIPNLENLGSQIWKVGVERLLDFDSTVLYFESEAPIVVSSNYGGGKQYSFFADIVKCNHIRTINVIVCVKVIEDDVPSAGGGVWGIQRVVPGVDIEPSNH